MFYYLLIVFPLGNLYLEIEKFSDGKYKLFVDKSFCYPFEVDQPESRSNYNELKPGDSAVLSFNLISRIGAVYKGKYRIRIHLLKTPNNYPVRYEMGYAISKWFYFDVIKDLDYHVIQEESL